MLFKGFRHTATGLCKRKRERERTARGGGGERSKAVEGYTRAYKSSETWLEFPAGKTGSLRPFPAPWPPPKWSRGAMQVCWGGAVLDKSSQWLKGGLLLPCDKIY